MFRLFLLSYIFYSSAVDAYPATNATTQLSTTIRKRNPCDGKNAEPILYHDYKNDICPPPFTFEAPGQCRMKRFQEPGWNPFRPLHCGGFCEENVSFRVSGMKIKLSLTWALGQVQIRKGKHVSFQSILSWAYDLRHHRYNNNRLDFHNHHSAKFEIDKWFYSGSFRGHYTYHEYSKSSKQVSHAQTKRMRILHLDSHSKRILVSVLHLHIFPLDESQHRGHFLCTWKTQRLTQL